MMSLVHAPPDVRLVDESSSYLARTPIQDALDLPLTYLSYECLRKSSIP